MLPEIGQLALVLALLLALVQATLPLTGAARAVPGWVALARSAAYGQAAFVAVAFGCLAAAFLGNDFSVANVATNSNSKLPAVYRFAATWGSHEGSLLLWLLLLNGWSVGVARFGQRMPPPILAPLLFLMGIGPLARWRQASLPELARRLRRALPAAAAVALAIPLLAGGFSGFKVLGYFLAAWIVSATLVGVIERLAPDESAGALAGGGFPGRLRRQGRSWIGMAVAHLGVAVTVIGITTVKGYEVERDLRLAPGAHAEVGDYLVHFTGVEPESGPNYRAQRATVELTLGGQPIATLHPEKRVYTAQPIPMTEAAIDRGAWRDLYVSLGEPAGDGAWSMRVQLKPLVGWIWAGCVLMALGGAIAASDKRARSPVDAATAAASPNAH